MFEKKVSTPFNTANVFNNYILSIPSNSLNLYTIITHNSIRMIYFFGSIKEKVFGVQTATALNPEEEKKLSLLFGDLPIISKASVNAFLLGLGQL